MRITAGLYKGRRIKCPKGIIRPAMDRMRESLFSILGNIAGLSFLDLFSGSGVLGIEAASRGASRVMLIEKDRIKKEVILENISFVESDIKLNIMPAERYVKMGRDPFDIVFLDPPFPLGKKLKVLEAVEKSRLMKPHTLVLMHYPSEEKYPDEIGSLKRFDSRKYGRSILDFYEYLPEGTE